MLALTDKGASNLASLGFVCFLVGRFTGAGLLRKFAAHKVLGIYGTANVIATLLVFLKLGWLSVVCVFLSFFFMSIMFPTIFALGIFGLGARAKKASSFIVMAIMGGALLPKLMGTSPISMTCRVGSSSRCSVSSSSRLTDSHGRA